jgi:hypothetical protein
VIEPHIQQKIVQLHDITHYIRFNSIFTRYRLPLTAFRFSSVLTEMDTAGKEEVLRIKKCLNEAPHPHRAPKTHSICI